MRKLHWAEYIFSVNNDGTDKLVVFLGIPFRVDRSGYFKRKCMKLAINDKKIVFCNFNGNSYGCNPKYITEEILKQHLPLDIVWLVKDVGYEKRKKNFPSGVRLVGYRTKEALDELASARVWVDNQRKNYFIKKGLVKKDRQYYIQTWHGSLGIKKVDSDVGAFVGELKKDWVNRSKYDSCMTDYLITNSRFETEILPKALWFNNKIIQTGHPRNDIFFRNKKDIGLRVKQELGINKDHKIVLYAPSFRDDKSRDCYGMDYAKVTEAIEKRFGGKWDCVVRLHPRVRDLYERIIVKQGEGIINGCMYPDIQELLAATDIMITDYSSCIFDFMLSGKPGFVYAQDEKEYRDYRGFYYPLEQTPFAIARDNEELVSNILAFDEGSYRRRVEEFLETKGCIEDGNASKRVTDLIKHLMLS